MSTTRRVRHLALRFLTLCTETDSLAFAGSLTTEPSFFYITCLQAYTIVLAILIAMIATTVAFFTFFRLRAHWQDNFIKRTACALVLAIAVCGEYRSYILRRRRFGRQCMRTIFDKIADSDYAGF
jgi:hypothetical protein